MTTTLIPLSPAQLGVWLNEQRDRLGPVYHMPFRITFDGPFDRDRLRAAVHGIVAAHPPLRSAFVAEAGVPAVVPAERTPWLAGEPVDIAEPFDLERGPLLRMSLVGSVLTVVAHHLVFDGESMELFGRELMDRYQGSHHAPVPPTEPDTDPDIEAAREFWQRRWREPVAPTLPGLTRTVPETGPGEAVEFTVDTSVRDRAERLGVTTFEFLLATLYGLLSRYGNGMPTVTIPLGIRARPDRSRIGMFANEVPWTVAVPEGTRFTEFARELRKGLRELYPYRRIPLNQIVTGLRPAALHTAVAMSYRWHEPDLWVPGLRATAEWLFNGACRGALWIQVLDAPAAIRVVMRYAPTVLDRAHAETIAADWQRFIAEPDIEIGASPVEAVSAPSEDAPQGTEDRVLLRLWRQVLRDDTLGPDADIFRHGVTSLAMAQVAARLREQRGVVVPLDVFYDAPTIAGQAAAIERLSA
jgi:aryl carrier-like protein